jgi:hypothetical protein
MIDDFDDVSPMEDDAYEQVEDEDESPLMGWISYDSLSGSDDFSDDEMLDDRDNEMDEWDDWGEP